MNGKSWFSMMKNADGSGAVINIYDEIGFWGVTAKDFRRQLQELGDINSIELRINSPGGDVIDGFAIYNMLMEHKAKITAKIEGWAASMASIIAMAADEIHMPSNTWMMIHNPWSLAMGDKEELRKMADILEKMEGHAVKAYQQHSKLSEKEITDLMNAETWMDGTEAVAKGFAEVVTDELQIAANVNNMKKLKAPSAAMVWVKAEEATPAPAPAVEETPKPAETPAEGTDNNGTQTSEDPAGAQESAKQAEETKSTDGTAAAQPPETKPAASGVPGISPEMMAKIDAAYDEGEAVGYDKGKKEVGAVLKVENDQLKASVQAKDQEISSLKAAVTEKDQKISAFDSRLSKLGSGLNASNMAEDAAPATFEEALKKYDWAVARKKFPALYQAYRDSQKKSRK